MQSSICFDVNLPSYRGVEQLVARRAHNPKVIGSSPIPATTKDGSVLLLVRFLFASLLSPVNELIQIFNKPLI